MKRIFVVFSVAALLGALAVACGGGAQPSGTEATGQPPAGGEQPAGGAPAGGEQPAGGGDGGAAAPAPAGGGT